ncbi:MAG: ATPase, T2SS/T4P/T4SS family [Burkholderia sp.]
MALKDLQFVDLYIGSGYADLKAEPGAHSKREPVPDSAQGEVTALVQLIDKRLGESGSECTVEYEGVNYRVTRMFDLVEKPLYFLRRIADKIFPVESLGLPQDVLAHVLAADSRGLTLFTGEMGSGKTTTGVSVFTSRLATLGGFGLALEQPAEIRIDGEHGKGRCMQSSVTDVRGGFAESLRLARRSGVSDLFIGEIRCGDTGAAALAQANSGVWVGATLHSKTPLDAISQLALFASQSGVVNPYAFIAKGLSTIVHQSISRRTNANGSVAVMANFNCLTISGSAEGIRSKIRDHDRLHTLAQDLDNQNRERMHGHR